MGGQQSACCNETNNGLYGLSFVDGQMLFLPLEQMAHLPASTSAAETAVRATQAIEPAPTQLLDDTLSDGASAIDQSPLTLTLEQLVGLEVNLHSHLASHFDGIGEVRAIAVEGRIQVHISVAEGLAPLPIREDAQQWLRSIYGAAQPIDIIIRAP